MKITFINNLQCKLMSKLELILVIYVNDVKILMVFCYMLVDRYIKNNKITCNIYGTNGELLIGVGTPINANIKKRLSERKWHLDKPSNYIYDNIVNHCVVQIEQGNYDKAYSRYKSSVLTLEEQFAKSSLQQKIVKTLKRTIV